MEGLSRISVVLPSLDPDDKLLTVIQGLITYGFEDIILVNDGSKAENRHYFEAAAAHPQVHLLEHPCNRGKGAALKTAFAWFLENRPDGTGVVTVDGDNQHHPEDTRACALHMLETGRLTLGVRDFSQPDVPFKSRNGNRITSLLFKAFVGMRLSDTQTGLRAIPRADLELLGAIAGERFEYETNMLLAMKRNGIPFDEVTIRTVYIEENKSSHFRAVRDSWRIYKLILAHFFKYALSSLFSAVVDEALFALLTRLLQDTLTGMVLTALPAAAARLASSLLNFFLNKNLVFHRSGGTGKALLRYYAFAIPIALLQIGLTHGICLLLRIGEMQTLLRSVIYAAVMLVLFFVNFTVQRRWVFARDEATSDFHEVPS